MQKSFTKFLILTIILTAALSVNYLFAAWSGPTQAPPGGNTSTPIHVGSTDQVKDGGLSVDSLAVFGNEYVQGNLDVDGGVEIGNTIDETAGTIRWTGSDFEGYDGTQWVSLVSGDVVVAYDESADCDAAGGDWHGGQKVCYFSGTSCQSGWSKKESYSSTASCHAKCPSAFHIQQNRGPEGCNYTITSPSRRCIRRIQYPEGGQVAGDCIEWEWTSITTSRSCTASITQVGCTKN